MRQFLTPPNQSILQNTIISHYRFNTLYSIENFQVLLNTWSIEMWDTKSSLMQVFWPNKTCSYSFWDWLTTTTYHKIFSLLPGLESSKVGCPTTATQPQTSVAGQGISPVKTPNTPGVVMTQLGTSGNVTLRSAGR